MCPDDPATFQRFRCHLSPPALSPPALVGPKPGEARAGLAMSVATFAMAAASAIQAVLYLSSFGTSGRTDGFFVAFALYTTIGVFSQSLRLTSVPLIVEPGARLTLREYAAALGLIGIPLLIVAGPFAGAAGERAGAGPRRRRPRRHRVGAAGAWRGDGAAAVGRGRRDGARGARPLQRDRGELHRGRGRRARRLPRAHRRRGRARPRLVDAGHGRGHLRLDAGRGCACPAASARRGATCGCARCWPRRA